MLRAMETDLKCQIGRGLARARTRRGLTQEELAGRVGRSVEAISNLERGVSFPSLKTMDALMRHLGISLRDLGDEAALPETARTRLELRARAILDQLSDGFLELAIEQLTALAKRDTRPRRQ
jgi:transcriptional regulator with XRE-family HTH domain